MLNEQTVQFTDCDVIGIEEEESPDGEAKVLIVFRGQTVPGGGETLTRVVVPIRPDLAEKIGESLVEEGKRLQGELPSGLVTAQPSDIAPTARAAERINGTHNGG